MDAVFSLPLQQRIDNITRWIDECPNKELEHLLPALVDNIFGESNRVGWGLRTIQYQNQSYDYDALFKFLHPHGPVFRLCYRLLSDTYLKYEFSLSYLPAHLKKTLEDGGTPTFYNDKLHYDHKTRQPVVLSLNPLEYYMFHFVFHLTNPWLEISCQESNMNLAWQTLYLRLSEQYMLAFLPLDGSPVLPPTTHYMVQSPNRSMPINTPNKPVRMPTLFRPDVLLKQNTTVHASTLTAPHLEVWRSELWVQLCVDFWFCVPTADNNTWLNQSWYQQEPLPQYWGRKLVSPPGWLSSSPPLQLNNTNMNGINSMWSQPAMPWPKQGTLATGEHLRVVRYFIKHMHYFANSRIENSSAMDELKRIIISSCQNKIYAFLKHTMEHWPLDASFRLILETWLSFIQPWRYSEFRNNMQGPDREERNTIIDERWHTFIADNLLAYTAMFKEIIARFMRLDLSTPRNALMLFRVTKVFAQSNLNTILKHMENSVAETGVKPSTNKWTSVVQARLAELEGPRYVYTPLFCTKITSDVTQFANLIQQAQIIAAEKLDMKVETNKSNFKKIVQWLFSDKMDSEYNEEERKKVPLFLESSLTNLSAIFQLPENKISDSPKSSPLKFCGLNQSGSELNPVEMRKRLWEMKYEGDPDLKPIQSFEVAVLVRLLYHIASWINIAYGSEICDLYTKDTVPGRIARQILWGPTTIFYFDKRIPGYSPRMSHTLPPRVSLRCWANHRLLGVILVVSFLVKFLSTVPVALVWFTVLFVWIAYLLFNAMIGRAPPVPNINDVNDISMFNAGL